jgi:hypothetical protein
MAPITSDTDVPVPHGRHLVPNPDLPLVIVAWRDDLVENHADSIAVCSDDMLLWWTPILGPSATLMAHQLALLLRTGASHTFTESDLAQTFGLSSSRLHATLERLHRFGVARSHGCTISLRLAMAPMSVRYQQRLPRYLELAYQSRP